MISVRSLPPFWYHWRSQRSDIISSEVKPLWVSVSISVVSDSVLVTVIKCSSEWICGFIICVLLPRSEEHTSELQSHSDIVCRLLLEKKKQIKNKIIFI